MNIASIVITIITNLFTNKLSEIQDKRTVQKNIKEFKDSLNAWIEEYSLNHDNTIITSDMFAEYIQNYKPINKVFSFIPDECIPNRESLIDMFLISYKEIFGAVLSSIDESLFKEFFSTINRKLCDFLESNMEIKDEILYHTLKEVSVDVKRMDNKIEKAISTLEGKNPTEIYSSESIDKWMNGVTSNPQIGLDFFQIDDDEFLNAFKDQLNREEIYIVGTSREETLYYILNSIKLLEPKSKIYVIKSEEAWDSLRNANINNLVLVPYFYSNHIYSIKNNCNIFIYAEDEPCIKKNKIVLKRRTRRSLVDALEKSGLDHEKAYKLVDDTNGVFAAIKKRMFSGASYQELYLDPKNESCIIAVLLCGKWSEYKGDQEVIEMLSEKQYADVISIVDNIKINNYPLVCNSTEKHEHIKRLTDVIDAWETLDSYISESEWNLFIELVKKVMIETEPIFKYPFEEHTEWKISIEKSKYSDSLKRGMLRSLTMRGFYCNHIEDQLKIDCVLSEILNQVRSKNQWGCIAQYFQEIAEASPKSVIERLEEEMANPTGLKEVFASNDTSIMYSANYYIHIIWALENLLQQKTHAVRAAKILFAMNDWDIPYKLSNSPADTLRNVFCPWINLSVFTSEQKKVHANWAVKHFESAWNLIFSRLPSNSGGTCSSLSKPRYRETDGYETLDDKMIWDVYKEYLNICIENAASNSIRWKQIAANIYVCYQLNEDVLNCLVDRVNQMADKDKIAIKNELREKIHTHRFYANAEWAFPEDIIQKIESTFNNIELTNKTYEYLYLFSNKLRFPILHPISYENSNYNGIIKQNEKLTEIEIKEGINQFKNNELSLFELVTLLNEFEFKNIGDIIAEYYDETFSMKTLKLLIDIDEEEAFCYIRYYILRLDDDKDIWAAISWIKENANKNLYVGIIRLLPINNMENSVIGTETDDIKEVYWHKPINLYGYKEAEIYKWAIGECLKYGSLETYFAIIYNAKSILPAESIYDSMLKIDVIKDKFINYTYYIEEIIRFLEDEFIENANKCYNIAFMELKFNKLINVGQMKCLKRCLEIEPDLYAWIIKMIFKQDGQEEVEVNDEYRQFANVLYRLYIELRFCPALENGEVEYNKLIAWTDNFKSLLETQNQQSGFASHMGKILANSPIGDDNLYPCESIRKYLEENYSKDMRNSYVISERNKRGVYTASAGKSEMEYSRRYKANADHLRDEYPLTADIYDMLSLEYELDARRAREYAENES